MTDLQIQDVHLLPEVVTVSVLDVVEGTFGIEMVVTHRLDLCTSVLDTTGHSIYPSVLLRTHQLPSQLVPCCIGSSDRRSVTQ